VSQQVWYDKDTALPQNRVPVSQQVWYDKDTALPKNRVPLSQQVWYDKDTSMPKTEACVTPFEDISLFKGYKPSFRSPTSSILKSPFE
jgi:hypothetical protein